MKRQKLIHILFIIYISIELLNLAPVILIFGNNKALAPILLYGNFGLLVFTSLLTIKNIEFQLTDFFKKNKLIIYLIHGYYLVGLVSALFSEDLKLFFEIIPIVVRISISIVLLTWIISYLVVKQEINIFIQRLCIVLFFGVTSILVLNYFGIELSYLLYTELDFNNGAIGRATGFFLNANVAAQFCVFTFIFLLHWLTKRNGIYKKIQLLPLFAIVIYSIYLTFSNTGFVNLAIISLLFFFMQFKKKILAIGLIVTSFLVLQVIIVPASRVIAENYFSKNHVPSIQQDKIENFLNLLSFEETKNIDYSMRDKLVSAGIQKIEDRPLLGHGMGSFSRNIYETQGIHNNYLQVIGETGLPFFIFFMTVIWLIFFRMIKSPNHQNKFLFLGIMIANQVYMLTSHNCYYNEKIIFFMVLSFVLMQASIMKTNNQVR